VIVDHTGADDGDPLHRVDLDDRVHRLGGQQHAPVDGVGTAGQARTGPARHDRDPVPQTRFHHALHLLGRARPDDQDRDAVCGPLGLVVDVALHDVGVVDEAVLGNLLPQVVEKHRSSTRCVVASPDDGRRGVCPAQQTKNLLGPSYGGRTEH
jgi:hypothetical protein